MPHVFDGEPDERQSDDADHRVSRFRPTYRALAEEEKRLHDEIKVRAQDLELAIDRLPRSREQSLAMTKLEEAVMWAIKGLTANP